MSIQSLTLSLLRAGVNLSSPFAWVSSGNALIYGLSDGNDAVQSLAPDLKAGTSGLRGASIACCLEYLLGGGQQP